MYFTTTIQLPPPWPVPWEGKRQAQQFLKMAAMGGSLAAEAALKAVEALPEGTRPFLCTQAAIDAAIGAVEADWSEGAGLANLTIQVGTDGHLIYRSCGRFRAVLSHGWIDVVIQGEDAADALDSLKWRMPDFSGCLSEVEVETLASDGLGILL